MLPEHARAHNRALVMQTLFHEGAISRADLSRQTGLTRVTISDLVSGLIDDRLVNEVGTREAAGPGKPAILIDIARDAHRIVSLDLSDSTHLSGAVLSFDGEIVQRRQAPVPHNEDVLAGVRELAAELVSDSDAPVLGIGVGTPGVVDDSGVILAAPNLGWDGFDLAGSLNEALGLPVLVANDANAAVLAEHTYADSAEDVLLVKIGRGVGAGLLLAGRPMRGSRFGAGEIGHVAMTDDGPVCVCGKSGCLEAWLSAPAIEARLAGAADDEARTEVLRDAGERLGATLAPIVAALDLSEIVLSGPEAILDGPLSAQTVRTVNARVHAPLRDEVSVRRTRHGSDIVLLGAAVMVLSGQLGVS